MKVVKYVTAGLCLLLTAVTLSLLTIQTVDLPKAVEISLTVDREACQPGESVIATLAAQNTGSRGVGDVEMEVLLPDGCAWTGGSPEAEKELWGLESGESASHSVILALPAQAAAESSPGLLERYGLQAEILLLTLGVVGMALLIAFGREHKVLLSALFVSAVFLGLILPFALQGARALFLRDTVRTECVVQLEDREVRLEGKVSYLPQPPAGERPADVYTVIFDVGGGSPVAPQQVEEGGYLSPTEIPTREGYTFAGWYEDRELTKYFTLSHNPITRDMVLYAMWWEGEDDPDSDGDGVSDLDELCLGSDPYTADDITTDTDGDGLIDYLEIYLCGTDIHSPDTDGDGLSDYEEAALVRTDPTLADTDGDGIGDYDSDQDGDGISNGRELELGTDPLNRDTDGDGLEDGEEINTYYTNPLSADTDGDGASDGWEVEHGYDPLAYNDSFSVSASAAAQDGAVTAQVSLSCSGDPASLSVEETTQAGLLDSSVPGYVGSAFEFNADVSFESATITFAFDPNAVPEDAELVIYYFNEEKQLLEPLETTVSDGRATAQVTHFSTYILLNKKMMDQVWEKEILAPGSQAYNETVFNIAFVIDYSASMDDNDPEDLRLSIVDQFIGKLRDGQDQASVVKFAAYATTLVPLSTDKEMLSNAVTGITNNSGDGCDNEAGTNGSDGLHAALEQLEGAEGDYKYIIFLTDGEDNKYSYEYTDLIDQAKEEGVVIYSIGMGDADEELLTNIAQSTGGKFYYATAVEMEDVTGEGLMDAFHDIQISTIDFETDSNRDGISDYYTRLLCSGQLRTGTGIALFDGISYEAVQANKDYDGDGVPNGEEVVIRHDSDTNKTYLYVISSPVDSDTDKDGILDQEDTAPLTKGLKNGIIGEMILLSCGENAASTIVIDQLSGGTLGASTGHAFLIYNSYVNDTLDLSGYNFGYSVDPETGSFPLDIQKGKDDSPNAAYGLLVGGAISMSAGGTTVDDARCAVYNLEFVKHARGVSYSPNAYLVNKVTQTELDALLQAFEGESKKSYEAVGYNCTDVSLNVWNQIFGTDLNTKGVLHLVNIHTPRGLKCQIEDMKEGQVNLNLDEFVQ